MNEIVLFTLNGCGHCTELKNLLNESNIEFTELEVTENNDIWEEVVKKTNNEFLPTVFINVDYSSEGPIFVPEKDYKNNEEALEIIKKYI